MQCWSCRPDSDPTATSARHSASRKCHAPVDGSNTSKSLLKATSTPQESLSSISKVFLYAYFLFQDCQDRVVGLKITVGNLKFEFMLFEETSFDVVLVAEDEVLKSWKRC